MLLTNERTDGRTNERTGVKLKHLSLRGGGAIKGKQLRRSPRVRESYVAFFYLLCERVFDVCFRGNDVGLFLTNPWRSLGALSRQSVRASIRRPKLPGFVHPFLVLCDWGEKISSLVQQTRAQMKKCGITRLRS